MAKYRMVGMGKKLGLMLRADENQWFMFTEYGVKNNQQNGVVVLTSLLEWCNAHGIKTCVLPRKWSIFNYRLIPKMNSIADKHGMLLSLDVIERVLHEMTVTGKEEIELVNEA